MKVLLCLSTVFLVVITETSTGSLMTILGELDMFYQKAKDMQNALANDNANTAEDVAISFLEQIPIIGTVLNMITGGNDAIHEKLDDTIDKLKQISVQQQRMMSLVEDIKLKVGFLTTNILISTAAAIISSCSKDRRNVLLDPKSQQAKDRILRPACSHDIMDSTRNIVRILKGERVTLDSPELYAYLKNTDGSCDGPNIINTYKYLFGLVLDGCQTAIIAEEMLYNGTSKIMLTECRQETIYVSAHYRTIFNRFLNSSCDEVQTVINNSVSQNINQPLNEQRNTLSTLLPWFKFLFAKFSANPEFKMIGVHPPSEMIIHNNSNYLVILWTSYATNWSRCTCDGAFDSSPRFMVGIFNSKVLEEESIGINVTMSRDTNPGIVTSCVTEKNSLLYKPCAARTINVGNSAARVFLNVFCLLLCFSYTVFYSISNY